MLICKTSMEEHEEGMLYECSYLNGHVASLFFETKKWGLKYPARVVIWLAKRTKELIDQPRLNKSPMTSTRRGTGKQSELSAVLSLFWNFLYIAALW